MTKATPQDDVEALGHLVKFVESTNASIIELYSSLNKVMDLVTTLLSEQNLMRKRIYVLAQTVEVLCDDLSPKNTADDPPALPPSTRLM